MIKPLPLWLLALRLLAYIPLGIICLVAAPFMVGITIAMWLGLLPFILAHWASHGNLKDF